MKIGAMNDPSHELYEQIGFIGENFDFLDFTIEPGTSYPENLDIKKLKSIIKKHNLEVIGHTAWSLPIASPFSRVRKVAFEEFRDFLKVFKKLGVRLVNVHPHTPQDLGDIEKILEYNIKFLRKIVKEAKKHDMTIMMENTQGIFNEVEVLGKMLDDVPGLMMHWDVGHANLGNEGEKKTREAFEKFSKKIKHVHISDNKGIEDQHLPIGAGNINWKYVVQMLKEFKYDKTVTLEIHTPDPGYLLFSRDKLKFILEKSKGE